MHTKQKKSGIKNIQQNDHVSVVYLVFVSQILEDEEEPRPENIEPKTVQQKEKLEKLIKNLENEMEVRKEPSTNFTKEFDFLLDRLNWVNDVRTRRGENDPSEFLRILIGKILDDLEKV